MNKDVRIQKIQEEVDLQNEVSKRINQPLMGKEIWWDEKLTPMSVYKISLDYLIYNQYNGRILSRTKSLEASGGKIHPETEEGKKMVDDLLWSSKEDRNRQTKDSIKSNGQEEVGIITRDGIVIDGNRRVMLLNRLTQEGIQDRNTFKTVVLPVTLEEKPIEIERLETTYQMGADEKLGYNPIEKYLKAKDHKSKGIPIIKTAKWMGESVSTIRDYLAVMETMDDYLDYLDYNNYYTQLDSREDQLINLTKWIKTFYGTGSAKADWGYKDADVDDLKIISFDYIRAKYEGKSMRIIGSGQHNNHFFGNKEIWKSFLDKHFLNIQPIHNEEENINFDSPVLVRTLNSRDTEFTQKAKPLLEENLKEHEQRIYNQKHKDEPEKLIAKSIDAVNVARSNKNIEKPDVIERVKQLNEITTNILQKKSPKGLLKQILNLLSSVSISKHIDEKEDMLEYIKDIEREAFQLEKEIKHLR